MLHFVNEMVNTTIDCMNFVSQNMTLKEFRKKAKNIQRPGSRIFLCTGTPYTEIFLEYVGTSNYKRIYRFVQKIYLQREVTNYSCEFSL